MPHKTTTKQKKTKRSERIERMDPEVLDVEGAAQILGVSKWTILKLVRLGTLPGKKVGKEWRFRRTTLLRWLGETPNGGGDTLEKLFESGRVEIVSGKAKKKPPR